MNYVRQLRSAEKICQRPQDWNPGDFAASGDSSPSPPYRASRTNFSAHCVGNYNGGGSSSVLCDICQSSRLCAISVRNQDNYIFTSRPCRTLFGYCPPPALGSRKADMRTLSFFFPTPYPCHVARKQLSSPDIMGGRAACALHPFLLCPEHDNGWVRWRTLLIPTNTSK